MKQEIIKFNFKFKNNEFYVSNKNELAYKMIKKWVSQDDLIYIKNHNWIIDDVDYIINFADNKYEEKILNFINIIKTCGEKNLLMASRKMPRFLGSDLKDLISRISSATVIEMRDPDEILLKKIIEKYLSERNIQINNESLNYLINRIERSYKSALKIAKKIDISSLEQKTKINKFFLKSILN